MRKTYLFIGLLFFSFSLIAQQKGKPQKTADTKAVTFDASKFVPNPNLKLGARTPNLARTVFNTRQYQSIPSLTKPSLKNAQLQIVQKSKEGLPIFIKCKLPAAQKASSLQAQVFYFLEEAKGQMKISSPSNEFMITKTHQDDLGHTHIRLQQKFQGIEVYGSEIILHAKQGQIYLMNGRYFKTPSLSNLTPNITTSQVVAITQQDVSTLSTLKDLTNEEKLLTDQSKTTPKLVIYYHNNTPILTWHLAVVPNIMERYEYFVDAHSGVVLHKRSTICKIHTEGTCSSHSPTEECNSSLNTLKVMGPATANATDLKGITQNINVWEEGGTFFMLDGSRSMFSNSSSNMPNSPVGAIWTIDAQNIAPQPDGSLNIVQITSSNNSWNNPIGVSAHNNAGIAYTYFKNNHNRNSINGSGGNVVSIINVTETGAGLDNAFWNGAAMFYGNGNQAFSSPLAKALDVAGHELSHGVIQNTANLVYENQSGALNESFADVFGFLIDDTNWQIGEDVVNTSIFPSGALRDLSDPHNGGNQAGDNGWQPSHMNEFLQLPNTAQGDNGGVHSNSGIPNKAFHLFATAVGNAKAGQVYYRALTEYLHKSSKFIDCRLAVIQSANDLFGSTEANAAANAFAQVGIGDGAGTNTQIDLSINPGSEFLVMVDDVKENIYYYDFLANPFVISTTDILNNPSVTDDGSLIVFISASNTLKALEFNTNTGQYDEYDIEQNPQQIWRNISISKDGTKMAALLTDLENSIFVFDFVTQQGMTFELYNPTTSQGIKTGDVQYADIMEWDYTGNNIMYDAYNVLDDGFGGTIDYWDIGFINVLSGGAFSQGNVFKLFSGLPENTSVGNPAFSKNSPYIIAFDLIDGNGTSDDYFLMAANTETGDVGLILENVTLSYPNYSVKDDQLLFDTEESGNIRLAVIGVGSDKISPNGGESAIINGAQWGNWHATGTRQLLNTTSLAKGFEQISVQPNPFHNSFRIQFESTESTDAIIKIYDIFGKLIESRTINVLYGSNDLELTANDWSIGTYIIHIQSANATYIAKVVKD